MLPIPPIPPRIKKGTAQGQLAFWDATLKKWTYLDITEIFWDDVNKRLGLNNSSPSEKLDVVGNVKLTEDYKVYN